MNEVPNSAAAMTVVRPTDRFDEMVEFYGGVLAWRCVYEFDEGPDNRGKYFSPGEGTGRAAVEVVSLGDLYDQAKGRPENISLTVEIADADAVHDYLQGRGVSIERGLEDTPWGHRSFGVDDPDGLRIWFYHVV